MLGYLVTPNSICIFISFANILLFFKLHHILCQKLPQGLKKIFFYFISFKFYAKTQQDMHKNLIIIQ